MASEAESTPAHLSRMPYEILQLILAEVSTHSLILIHTSLERDVQFNQKDQINASKTCILLWWLAYPMAYNCITAKIGPDQEESEW
jgi:hypothetical protein